MGGGGKGGSADVEYTQSPEQQAVYRALQPMVQKLGMQYGGYQPMITNTNLPATTTQNLNMGNLTAKDFTNLVNLPASQVAQIAQQFTTPQTTPFSMAQSTPLYNIPHPAEAVSTISPLVSPALWNPYQEAESQLMDVLQSRGQLGAPGAGLSGAASAGLGKFYEQAARDIGLQSYQMAMPLWQAQLQREQMPWQMLPGLLGGTYSTGIAQQEGNPLASGLMGAGTAFALGAGWPAAIALGAGSMLGGK